MGYMRIGHEKVLIADLRLPVFLRRRPVDRRAFPDDIVVADGQVGFFIFVANILRRCADARKGMYLVPLTDRGPSSISTWEAIVVSFRS